MTKSRSISPYSQYRPSSLKVLKQTDRQTLIEEILRLQNAIQKIAIELGLEPNESGKVGWDFNPLVPIRQAIQLLRNTNLGNKRQGKL